ncbi:MAG: transmembrane 220 family protein [Bacteroidota bacterium]|nr:transmembrane 220 family protein [Bacteroidota bacterium]
MKVLNIIFIILFIFSAALQYNDPDPLVWISIYLYGALLCYLAFKRKYNYSLYIIGLVVYIGYAIYLLFEKNGVLSWANDHDAENILQSMKATKPWIEDTREFFGLLLLIVALIANMIWFSKNKKAATDQKIKPGTMFENSRTVIE